MRALVLVAVLLSACALIGHGTADQLDVNAADRVALATLPGADDGLADRIVTHRPYAAKEDLLRRKVLTEEQYTTLAPHLYVGPPGTPDYLREVAPMPKAP